VTISFGYLWRFHSVICGDFIRWFVARQIYNDTFPYQNGHTGRMALAHNKRITKKGYFLVSGAKIAHFLAKREKKC
jgi:hypothetical protein